MPEFNIFTLDTTAHVALLSNGHWKQTDYYELCCKSEGWGCALFISIAKEFAPTETEALTYGLQRLVIESESLQKATYTSEDYVGIRNLMESNLLTPNGIDLSPEEFWRNYEEIYAGIIASHYQNQPPTLFKNGVQIRMQPLVEKKDVCLVTCFANEWNHRQYLVETGDNWVYFEWSTGA